MHSDNEKEKNRKTARVEDFEEIFDMMTNDQRDMDAYLDVKMGKIVYVAKDNPEDFISLSDEEPEEEIEDAEDLMLIDEIENNLGTRYLEIPSIEHFIPYNFRVSFIETIDDVALQNSLFKAIKGRGAFRRFKDILLDHPSLQERWRDYEAKKQEEVINDWLEKKGFELKKG